MSSFIWRLPAVNRNSVTIAVTFWWSRVRKAVAVSTRRRRFQNGATEQLGAFARVAGQIAVSSIGGSRTPAPVCAAPPSWGRHPQTFTKTVLTAPKRHFRSPPKPDIARCGQHVREETGHPLPRSALVGTSACRRIGTLDREFRPLYPALRQALRLPRTRS